MRTLNNIGLFLIGWDKNIMKECGEASFDSTGSCYQLFAL